MAVPSDPAVRRTNKVPREDWEIDQRSTRLTRIVIQRVLRDPDDFDDVSSPSVDRPHPRRFPDIGWPSPEILSHERFVDDGQGGHPSAIVGAVLAERLARPRSNGIGLVTKVVGCNSKRSDLPILVARVPSRPSTAMQHVLDVPVANPECAALAACTPGTAFRRASTRRDNSGTCSGL